MKEINKKLFGIDTVLSRATKLTFMAIIISLLSVIFVVLYSLFIFNQSSNNIYVLDYEGDINPASKTKKMNQLEAEADNHIRMFYETFFSYDPSNINQNVTRGLELGGNSVKDIWKVYKNQNWYNQIKQNNLIVKSVVDSTFFDFSKKPYRARVFGKQILRSGDSKTIRNLNFDCTITLVSRVKKINPHGMLIDNLIITNNNPIKNN